MSNRWKSRSLGELCDFVRGPFGGSLKKSCFKPSGYAVYEQQHAIYDQFDEIRYFVDEAKYLEMQRFKLTPGDLIMSCSGTMGKIAIVPDGIPDGIINQALLKLSPGEETLAEFLQYWMSSPSFQNELSRLSQGVAIKNVASVKVLKEIQVSLPSVVEQKRIVAILDEVFAGIDDAIANAEKNLINARELFESYVNAIFNQKGNGWKKKTLDELCLKITDGVHHTPAYTTTGIPFLSVKNLTKGFVDFSNTKFVSPEAHEILIKRCNPEVEDVLYTKVGTTGVAKVIDTDREFSLFVSVALLKINHEVIFNRFLEHFLNSELGRDQARKRTRGMANKNLVIRDIRQITVLYPQSKINQKAVVAKIDALKLKTQHLEAIYQQKLTALNELKQSILQKAFTGELTADTANQAIRTKAEIAA